MKKNEVLKLIMVAFLLITIGWASNPPASNASGENDQNLKIHDSDNNLGFDNPKISCLELDNKDDCLAWRAENNFYDRYSEKGPCSNSFYVAALNEKENTNPTELTNKLEPVAALQEKENDDHIELINKLEPAAGRTKQDLDDEYEHCCDCCEDEFETQS